MVGTEGDDHIVVHKSGSGNSMRVVVQANFGGSGITETYTFPISSVTTISMEMCGGNDHVTIGGNGASWNIRTTILGGEGDDRLQSDAGRDILIGGFGSDDLKAGDDTIKDANSGELFFGL